MVSDEVMGGKGLTEVATKPARVSIRGPPPAWPGAGAPTWNHGCGKNWTIKGGSSSTGAGAPVDPPSSMSQS